MNGLARLAGWLRPKPKSPEELAAKLEADRLRAEQETLRSSRSRHPGSGAGEKYESQRRR